MLEDIRTVMWKELREILRQDGELKNGLSIFIMPVALGVLSAFCGRMHWPHPVMALIFALFIPVLCISAVVADSFAGERERQTLEALLATRLSDRAILLGKLLSMVLWAWAVTLVFFLTGVITVNVVVREPGVVFFGVPGLLAAFLVPPLAALAAGSFGMHYSLRAGSVRQAQMLLGYSAMGLLFIPGFALRLMPVDMRNAIIGFFTGLDPLALVLSTALFLLAESFVAVQAAQARFRRARLIMD